MTFQEMLKGQTVYFSYKSERRAVEVETIRELKDTDMFGNPIFLLTGTDEKRNGAYRSFRLTEGQIRDIIS